MSTRCRRNGCNCLENSVSPYFLVLEKNFIKDNREWERGMQMVIDWCCTVAMFQVGFKLTERLLLTYAAQR